MLGFGKTKKDPGKKKRRNDAVDVDPSVDERIHVMPERFYVAPKKNRSGLWALITIGILVIGGLAGAAFYLNEDLKRNSASINQPVVNQPPVNAEPVNQPVNVQPVATTTIPVSAPATTTPETSTSTDDTISPPVELPRPLPSAVDADGDKLTEVEEQLFGTNPSVADTDGDTFGDGDELLNGYDPARPKQPLAASILVLSYTHPRYTLLYPRSWLMRDDEKKDDVRFISETGELVEVLTIANPRRQVLPDWYREQFPNSSISDLTTVKIGTLSGLRSADELHYYFADPNQNDIVYVISYNVGTRTTTNFAATFTMIVKSFKLIQ